MVGLERKEYMATTLADQYCTIAQPCGILTGFSIGLLNMYWNLMPILSTLQLNLLAMPILSTLLLDYI